jgi:hypothetical protein
MADLPGLNESSIERALRDILEPLDRHLERGNTFLAAALLGIVPTTFFVLWLIFDLSGKHALGWAALAFGVVIVLGVCWDAVVARLARWRFNSRFPFGSPEREAALRILDEMETPSKAEERLRSMLSRSSVHRVVRRRQETALPPADAVPAIDPVPPTAPLKAPQTPPPPGKGGYYDYIPLELRQRQEE